MNDTGKEYIVHGLDKHVRNTGNYGTLLTYSVEGVRPGQGAGWKRVLGRSAGR